MTRRGAALALVAALALLAAALFWLRRSRPSPAGAPRTAAAAPHPAESVDLYFAGAPGLLYRERRELMLPADERGRLRAAVEAWLAGPRRPGLEAPLPAGVEVAELVLGPDGVVFVDLRSADGPPPLGSTRERLLVYGLVHTVLGNSASARRVVLLWNGSQPRSFAGHLDLSRPLGPAPELVAESP